jgi:hypothetical protein
LPTLPGVLLFFLAGDSSSPDADRLHRPDEAINERAFNEES